MTIFDLSSWQQRKRPAKRSPRRRKNYRPLLEAFEDRLAPAVTGLLTGTTLSVNLDADGDVARMLVNGTDIEVRDQTSSLVFAAPIDDVTDFDIDGNSIGTQTVNLNDAFNLTGVVDIRGVSDVNVNAAQTAASLFIQASDAVTTQAALESTAGSITLKAGGNVEVDGNVTTPTGVSMVFSATADSNADGTGTYSQSAASTVNAGRFVIEAADIDLLGTLHAASTNSQLIQSTATATVGIESPGSFNLTDAELDRITLAGGSALLVGRSHSGDVAIAVNAAVTQSIPIQFQGGQDITIGTFDYTATSYLSLVADQNLDGTGSITTAGGRLISSQLFLNSGAGINLLTDAISFSAINRVSGDIVINELNSMTVSSFGIDVQGGGGSVDLTAGGTVTISADINANGAGTVTLNSGVYRTTGSGSITGDTTVKSGATLGGAGTVDGTVTVESGGAVAPGASPGTLTTGDFTLGAGAALNVELNGLTTGSQHDQLIVVGDMDVSAASLNVTSGFTPSNGDTFVIIDNQGTEAVTGTFADLAEGAILTAGGEHFRITYVGGTGGNDVVLVNLKLGEVHGLKFADLNANGVQDGGEPGLPGWTIFADLNGSGDLGDGEPSTTTLSDGSYVLANVPVGAQIIAEVVQSGWQQSTPAPTPGTTPTPPNPPILARTGVSNTTITTDITSDTTWTKASGPYFVQNSIIIDAGAKLTIEPGVEILFDAGARLTVDGELVAVGTAAEPILFTSVAAAPASNDWAGILVRNTNGGHLTLQYVTLEYASTAVTVQCCGGVAPGTISDSVIRHNATGLGGYSGSSTKLFVYRSVFDDNTNAVMAADKDIHDSLFTNNQNGLYQTERINVYGSTFQNNGTALFGGRGVVQYSNINNNTVGVQSFFEGFTLRNNDITGNVIGILLPATTTIPPIEFNNIHGNTDFNAQNTGQGDRLLANNYWGSTDQTAIEAGIYDGRDGNITGLVLYEPILTSTAATGVNVPGTHTVNVVSGAAIADVDFGNYQFASLSGRKYDDVDNSGTRDANEPYLQGWTIYLDANGNSQLDIDEARVSTDASGNYSFSNLTPGSYTVREVLQNGWNISAPGASFYSVTLESNESLTGLDFGNHEPGRPAPVEIHGRKFNDLNYNGEYDSGEPLLSNWTIYLDVNGNRQRDSWEPSTTTDANGEYHFTNLPPNTYLVGEVLQANWQQSLPFPVPTTAPTAPPTAVKSGTANTTFSGAIAENTTWTAVNGPYHITGAVVVYAGATLTIEPGTQIWFDAGTRLYIRGTLVAHGTAAAPMLFTSSAATPARSDWSGIWIQNTLGGQGTLNFATIEYAATALSVSTGSGVPGAIEVQDAVFQHNQTGFGGYTGTAIVVARSLFHDNTFAVTQADKIIFDSIFTDNDYGLYQTERISVYNSTFTGNDTALYGGRGTVQYSRIAGNTTGIQAFFEGFTLKNNEISGNDVGLILPTTATLPTTISNNIHNNTTWNVRAQGSNDRNLSGNYWGTTDAAAIAALIEDDADNAALGVVTFDPILTEEDALDAGAVGQHTVILAAGEVANNVDFGNISLPVVTFTSVDRAVDEDVGLVTVTAELDQAMDFVVSVPILVQGSSAQPGEDYSVLATALAFEIGQTTASFTIDIIDDEAYEASETFIVSLAPTGQAQVGAISQNTITITDNNDPAPSVSFVRPDQLAPEGIGAIAIEARLSFTSWQDVTVPLTFSGSAQLTQDYTLPAGATITIAAGELIGRINVDIVDEAIAEAIAEATELIIIDLGAPTGATISTAPGDPLTQIVAIPQNDAPSVRFTSAFRQVSEGVGDVVIGAVLSNSSASEIRIPFTVSGSTNDYTIASPEADELVFPAGVTSTAITVSINDDGLAEFAENLVFRLEAASGVVLGAIQTHTVRIMDNDIPDIQIVRSAGNPQASQTVWENAGTVTFTVIASLPSTVPITVPISVSGQGSLVPYGYAKFNGDYSVITSAITIPAFATSVSRTVTIIQDTATEPTERIVIGLGAPFGNARLGDKTQHTIFISDDDPIVSIYRSTAQVTEGSDPARFTISLSAATRQTVTVFFNIGGTAARSGSYRDYSLSASSVTFLPGQTSRDVNVSIIDDPFLESNETVTLTLQQPFSGATRSTSSFSSTITIVDNDTPSVLWGPTLQFIYIPTGGSAGVIAVPIGSVPNPTTTEADRTLRFYVGLSRTINRDAYVTIGFPASPGVNSNDYRVTRLDSQNRLKIPAGQSSAYFEVHVKDDKSLKGNDRFEATEVIKIRLNGASNAILPANSKDRGRTITVIDNDKLFTSSGEVKSSIKPATTTSSSSSSTASPPPATPVGPVLIDPHLELDPAVAAALSAGDSMPSGVPTSTVDPFAGTMQIATASMGFLEGTTVFFDANFNGVADFLDINGNGIQEEGEPSEAATLTALDGSFSLAIPPEFDLNLDGLFTSAEGRWVLAGGVDVSVDLPVRLRLTAPVGNYVLTPLSTLVERLVTQHGLLVSEADMRVREAFALGDADLAGTNPLNGATTEDADAVATEVASVRLSNSVLAIADLFAGTPGAPPFDFLADLVFNDIAAKILAPGSAIDLSIESVIASVTSGVSAASGILLDADPAAHQAIVDGAAQVIAAGNLAIDSLPDTGDLDFLTEVFRIKKVMQGQAAPALHEVPAGARTIGDVIDNFTGANLQAKIDAATVGMLVPPALFINHGFIHEGDDGQQLLEIAVHLLGDSDRTVSVNFFTVDGTASADNGDYVPTEGTLTWEPGDNSDRIVQIPVNSNTVFEPDKTVLVFLADTVNAAVRNDIGYGFILNDDPFDHTTPIVEAGPNTLRLEVSEFEFGLRENDQLIQEGEFILPQSLTLSGQDGLDDTLILDFTASTYRSDTITFHGGLLGFDTAQIQGGDFQTIVQSFTNVKDGVTVLQPLDSDELVTFNWFDLEPFSISVGSVEHAIFELPAGVTDAVLEDADTDDDTDPGMMRLYSPSGAFEATTFTNPGGSLIIRGGNGADSIVIASIDPAFTGEIIIEGASLGSDGTEVSLQTNVNALSIDAAILDVDGAREVGNFSLTNSSTLRLNLDNEGSFDQLDVTGTVELNGAALAIVVGFTPDLGSNFTIIANDGDGDADPIGTHFAGFDEGTVFLSSGVPFAISYEAGDGNEVLLTVVNTPPNADAGGPYQIGEGEGLTLDASNTSDDENNITGYSWDLDNDGQYDDADGVSPSLTWDELATLGIGDDGEYPISVLVHDSFGESAAVQSAITVDNRPPTATNNAYLTNEDEPVAGNVITDDTGTGLDSDPAGAADPLAVTDFTQGANGVVNIDAAGNFSYTPNADFNGFDSFTYTISDGEGGSDTATVDITITSDNDAPVADADGPYPLEYGDDLTLDASASFDVDDGDSIVNYAWDLDNDGQFDDAESTSPSLALAWTALQALGLGNHPIALKVTDSHGATGEASSAIDIQDNTAPTLHLPIDQVFEAIGASGAVVNFEEALATDLADPNPVVTHNPDNGTQFPLGPTLVDVIVEDASGNTSSGQFTVTVEDTTAPTLHDVPTDVLAEATGPAGAVVTWTPPTASDAVDGDVTITSSHNSGDTFAIGTTTVAYTATDDFGNSVQGEFDVTVEDTTPPTIIDVPGNILQTATGAEGAIVIWSAPTANDVVDGDVTIASSHVAGEVFPLGTTTVTITAVDDFGNSSSAQFDVIVVPSGRLYFTDSDGDVYFVHLRGPGSLSVVIDDVGDGTGGVESITLHDTDSRRSVLTIGVQETLGNGHVDIGSMSGGGARVIKGNQANLVGDGIHLDGSLGTLVLNSVGNGAEIDVPQIGNFRLYGDFEGRLTLTTDGTSLRRATIGGTVLRSDWDLVGGAGYIRANGWTDTNLTASYIDKFVISEHRGLGYSGDVTGSNFQLNNNASRRYALGRISIAGAVQESHWKINGSVRSFSAGRFADSTFFVGFEAAGNPFTTGAFTDGFTIRSFIVSGNLDNDQRAFVNSTIAASSILRMSLESVEETNAEIFGVLTVEGIGRLIVGQPRVRYGGSSFLQLGEFVVSIV